MVLTYSEDWSRPRWCLGVLLPVWTDTRHRGRWFTVVFINIVYSMFMLILLFVLICSVYIYLVIAKNKELSDCVSTRCSNSCDVTDIWLVLWQPGSSSLMSGRVDSVRLTLDFAPSNVPVPPMATSISLSLVNECGALLANRTETIWQSWPVQTAIKDSFVWVMGPQRFVTLTPCKLAL